MQLCIKLLAFEQYQNWILKFELSLSKGGNILLQYQHTGINKQFPFTESLFLLNGKHLLICCSLFNKPLTFLLEDN